MNPPPPLPRASRLRAFAASFLALAAALAAAACGPSATVDGRIPDAALAEAPWEAAYAPDEMTEDVSGVVCEPKDLVPDADFVPVAGVRVELSVPRPDGWGPLVKVAETTTGEDGTWRLGKVPRGAWHVRTEKTARTPVIAGAGLRIPGAVDLTGDPTHRIALMAPRTVRGRVVLRDGGALSGVPVEAMGMTYAASMPSGADGSFEFQAPPVPVRVSLGSPTHDIAATVSQSGTQDLRVETLPVGEFAGRVVAAEDLRPIAGARIVSLDDPSYRATADADGRFRLPMPRAGWIAAFAAGRAWRPYGVPVAGDLEILLYPAPVVSGTVVGADGKPVAGARLIGLSTDLDGNVLRVNGPVSGADGRFEFSWVGLPPTWTDKRSAILAWHRRLGVSEAVVLPVAGPVELRLAGLGTVRGALHDTAGAPVAGADALVAWRLDPLTEEETGALGLVCDRRGVTAADGSFALDGVPLRRNRFVRVEAYGVRLEKILEPDAAIDGIRLALPAGKRLAGRVVDGKGAPPGAPARVTVRLLDVPGVSYERAAETGADGAFAFENVPPGRYTMEAEAQGFDIRGGNAGQAGDELVTLTVRRSAVLSVRLAPESGEVPQVALTVWVDDLDRQGQAAGRRQLEPGAAGGVVPVASLHPGRYRVRAEGDVWRGRIEEVVLTDGERRTVDVPLLRTLVLRGTLLDQAGAALPGARVDIAPVAGTAGQPLTATTGEGGVFEIAGVHPGRWEVRAWPVSQARLTAAVTMPAEAPLEFRMPPSGEVTVRVRAAGGGPARDAIVAVDDEDGQPVYAWGPDTTRGNVRFRVGDDGSVTIRGIPAGRVKVRASVDGGKTPLAPKEVLVEAGKPVEVSLP